MHVVSELPKEVTTGAAAPVEDIPQPAPEVAPVAAVPDEPCAAAVAAAAAASTAPQDEPALGETDRARAERCRVLWLCRMKNVLHMCV